MVKYREVEIKQKELPNYGGFVCLLSSRPVLIFKTFIKIVTLASCICFMTTKT